MHTHPFHEHLLRTAGEALLLRTSNPLPTLLLLSGGSALDMLSYAHALLQHGHLTIGMLDDRITKKPEESNFVRLLDTSFGKEMLERGIPVIDTALRAKESPTQLTQRFRDSLVRWRRANPDGRIIATMGIGSDGHTAGIFPHPEAPRVFTHLFQDEDWVVSYDVGHKHAIPLRLSVTCTFLAKEVDAAVVYAVGADKVHALQAVCARERHIQDTPARIIRQMKDVAFITDAPYVLE